MQFGDMGNIFQTMQKTQKEIENIHKELKNKHVDGNSGGGEVVATANGQQEIVKITINPEIIDSDPDEVILLEEMIVAAVNQAIEKSRSLAQEEISKLTGGLNIGNIMKMFQK